MVSEFLWKSLKGFLAEFLQEDFFGIFYRGFLEIEVVSGIYPIFFFSRYLRDILPVFMTEFFLGFISKVSAEFSSKGSLGSLFRSSSCSFFNSFSWDIYFHGFSPEIFPEVASHNIYNKFFFSESSGALCGVFPLLKYPAHYFCEQ